MPEIQSNGDLSVALSGEPTEQKDAGVARATFYFWKFIHNALVHPLMSLPLTEPAWLNRLHDWTGERCKGAG